MIAIGEVKLPETIALADRLASVHSAITDVVARYTPGEAAVEAPFHGHSARSALLLAHARGAVLAALGASSVTVSEYSPATIKLAVTGNGRAEKEQVANMVARLVAGCTASRGSDAMDAVAAALCHLFRSRRAAAIEKAAAVQAQRR